MAAATITQEMWEAVQRQIASHNEHLGVVNQQLSNTHIHVEALMAEVTKTDPLEIAVSMLEDLRKETKAKIDLAVEIMTQSERHRTLIDDKHKSRPTFDGMDPKKVILWCFKFKNLVCGKYPNAEDVLDWAKIQHDNKITTIKANSEIREI